MVQNIHKKKVFFKIKIMKNKGTKKLKVIMKLTNLMTANNFKNIFIVKKNT